LKIGWNYYGCIWDHIYDDSEKRWEDGHFINTSAVVNGILMQDEIIETKNSTYLLGVPATND